MNCDQAFERLTGGDCGDFGSESSLAEHLAGCTSCARLAEAMGPALELFSAAGQEAAGQDGGYAELPGIRGPWSTVATDAPVSQQGVRALSVEPALSQLMSLAAVLLVGLSLGGLHLGNRDESASMAGGGAASRMPARLLSAAALNSLQVTPACLPADAARPKAAGAGRARPALELLAQLDIGDLACCTLCHSAAGAAADLRQATLHVARSCSVCHTN